MNIQVNSKDTILQEINQYLFRYYLQQNDDSFVRQIPTIYSNLIILNSSIRQIQTLFKKVFQKPLLMGQFFQITVRMIISTYSLLLNNCPHNKLYVIIDYFQGYIKKTLQKYIKNRELRQGQKIINEQILTFLQIPKIYLIKDLLTIHHRVTNLFKTCRSLEKHTIEEVYVFYYYHYAILFVISPLIFMELMINFFTLVYKLEQNIVDYYHTVFVLYYINSQCLKEVINIKKNIEKCLDNKSLLLNNMIYQISNYYLTFLTNQQPQLLMYRRLQYLQNILIKFSNPSKQQCIHFCNIFSHLLRIQLLTMQQQKQKMLELYAYGQKLFPILYQQQLQIFLQQFTAIQINLSDKAINIAYQGDGFDGYIETMFSIYKNNPKLDSVRLLRSYINYLLKFSKSDQQSKQQLSKKIHFYEIFILQYQNRIKQYFQKIAQYFELYSFDQRKILFLKDSIFQIINLSQYAESQFKSLIDNFLLILVKQLIDKQGFSFCTIRQITHEEYGFIIQWLILKMQKPQQSQRVIFRILYFIQIRPTKDNIYFLVQLIDLIFGFPYRKQKEVIAISIAPSITFMSIYQNPYVLYLYMFIRLRQKQSQDQTAALLQLLIISIEKVEPIIQTIIRQIILYKIIGKKICFSKTYHIQKPEKKRNRFLNYARKNYLKNPINEVKAFNYPKLLINKNKSTHQKRETSYKLFVKKIDKYSKNIDNKEKPILKNFPNPLANN